MIVPKQIIVLGASGFIGRVITKGCLSFGHPYVKSFSSADCNLLNALDVNEKLSDLTGGSTLIFAAAITRLRDNSFDAMVRNIQMVQNVVDVLTRHKPSQVVYLSTVDVYGIDIAEGVKMNEMLGLAPNDYYSISKVTAEFLLKKSCKTLGIPLAILRLSGVYGPGDNGRSAVGAFLNKALTENKVCIYGKGDNLRDYVYVEDIYKIVDAILHNKVDGVINVATGQSYTIIEIVEIIKSLLPYKLDIEFKPDSSCKERRIKDMVFDTTLLKKHFPEVLTTDIRTGVNNYLRYIQKGENR